MKFDQLVVLLPCYSLETFDLERKDDDAEQLLSAWSALWHPLLLASARAIPRWLPAASPPEEPSGYLIILPDCCEALLPDDWLPQAEAAGACVLRNLRHRDDMLAAALERLDAACGQRRSRPGGRLPGLGVLPLPGRTVDSQVALHEQPRRDVAANRGAGGGRRGPQGRSAGRARPPPVGLRSTPRSPRVLLSHRSPTAGPDPGGRRTLGDSRCRRSWPTRCRETCWSRAK